MMKPMIFTALALVTACAAPAHNEAPTLSTAYVAPASAVESAQSAPEVYGGPAATCRIRETVTAQGVRLEAIAQANQSVYGEYDFTITAYSSGGSSDITQGGEVDLAAGQSATVGSAEIPRGRYRAILTLTVADGVLCDLERRS